MSNVLPHGRVVAEPNVGRGRARRALRRDPWGEKLRLLFTGATEQTESAVTAELPLGGPVINEALCRYPTAPCSP